MSLIGRPVWLAATISLVILAVLGSVGAMVWWIARSGLPASAPERSPAASSSPASTVKANTRDLGNGVSVEIIDSKYQAAEPGASDGWLESGQPADVMLSGVDFNNAGGPLLFNHPGGLASDGQRLILADRNNNRVLIWNQIPTANTEPDLVLCQANFTTNDPGTGLNQCNWPVAVATDGRRLLVADTENDRILVWTTFPTQNGQPADFTLGEGTPPRPGGLSEAERKTRIGWPWAVWTNGAKVIVTSTATSTVLIWNQFPTADKQPADLYIASEDFGTPRSIGSDGEHLIVGDHNAKPAGSTAGNFIWTTFPVRTNQPYDYFLAAPTDSNRPAPPSPPAGGNQPSPQGAPQVQQGDLLWSAVFTSDGRVYALGNRLYVWDSFPESADVAPSFIVGDTGPSPAAAYRFLGGDSSNAVLVGDRLYLSLTNGNKIVAFNTLPSEASARPDFAVGAPDADTNTLETNYFITNGVAASDGTSLFVSSDFDKTLSVWKKLPAESGAKPDLRYFLPEGAWDNALWGNNLALANRRTVYVWEQLPTEPRAPDRIYEDKIGSVQFEDLKGVALDDRYFYLADGQAGKVYIWKGIPEADDEPVVTLTMEAPRRISADGNYLAIAQTLGGATVRLYRVTDLEQKNPQPVKILPAPRNAQGGPGAATFAFNLPEGVLVTDNHLFVADTSFHRLLSWRSIDDAIAGKQPDLVLGAADLDDTSPEIGRDKLFMPASVALGGGWLWVSEFKFSGRVLGWRLK